MSEAAIYGAIKTKLAAFATVPAPDIVINVDNEDDYTPTVGTPYIQTMIDPEPTNTLFLNGGRRNYRGNIRADIRWPKLVKLDTPLAVADLLIAFMAQNTRFAGAGVMVKVPLQPWREPPITIGEWRVIPVVIPYSCQA